jgi:hypothetical protein
MPVACREQKTIDLLRFFTLNISQTTAMPANGNSISSRGLGENGCKEDMDKRTLVNIVVGTYG